MPALPAVRASRARLEPCLHTVSEGLRFGQALELLKRVVLDLPNPFAGDAEGLANLLERARLTSGQTEAKLDHLAFTLGQGGKRHLDVGAAQRQGRGLVRRLGVLVLDEVTECRVLLLA